MNLKIRFVSGREIECEVKENSIEEFMNNFKTKELNEEILIEVGNEFIFFSKVESIKKIR